MSLTHRTNARVNAHFQAATVPDGFPSKSCTASMELVHVSPSEFIRLERLGKRKRKPITLSHVSLERRNA